MDDMCRNQYGVLESNPLPQGYHEEQPAFSVYWNDARLEKIIRLRVVSDPGFPMWDITYCHGRLKDGTKVEVDLPFDAGQLPKYGWKKVVVEAAKKDGVYAKGLGIFNRGVISALI